MKSWYDGTNIYQTSTDVSRISVSGAKGHKNVINNSRKAKLEAELKLLEWHKLANDAALKVGRLINLVTIAEYVAQFSIS